MKKVKYIGFVLLLATVVCGCKSKTKDKSLYERGLELVERLEQMVQSDTYQKLYTMQSFEEKMAELKSADYNSPVAVYKIELTEDLTKNLEVEGFDQTAIDNMSNEEEKLLQKKIFQSISVRLNSEYGAEAMAVVSIFTDNKTFVNKDAKVDVIYLYIYEDAYPVIVDFSVGEDHTVSATGRFLMNKEIGSTKLEIEAFLQSRELLNGCKVVKVNK